MTNQSSGDAGGPSLFLGGGTRESPISTLQTLLGDKSKYQGDVGEVNLEHNLQPASQMHLFVAPDEERLVSGSYLEQAAVIVDQALDGHVIPTPFLKNECSPSAVRAFFVHGRLLWLWNSTLVLLVLLLFLEVPPWCNGSHLNPCGDPALIPLGGLPYISHTWVAVAQAFATIILAIKMLLNLEYQGGWQALSQDPVLVAKLSLIIVLGIDCAAASEYHAVLDLLQGLHLAYYIRIPTVIVFHRELRAHFAGLWRLVRSMGDFLILMTGFVAFSAWLAVLTFHRTEEGRLWFSSFPNALLNMFILLTTSNQPDMQIPAYNEWRGSALFFIVFFVLGLFVLMNLLLAVIFQCYKQEVANKLVDADTSRHEQLKVAFSILDREGRGWIDGDHVFRLMGALRQYRLLPHVHEDSVCHYLEREWGASIDSQFTEMDFVELCDEVMTRFPRLVATPHWLEALWPSLSRFLVRAAFDWRLGVATDCVLAANLVILVVEGSLYLADDPRHWPWFCGLIGFGVLYVWEMLLKILGRGLQNYLRGYRSRFDGLITSAITAVLVLGPFEDYTHVRLDWLRYLEILRLVRLTSLLSFFRRYKVLARTFMTLIPTMAPLIGLLFCTLCLFCAVGVQWFGGLIYPGNPKLKGTAYLANNYTSRNFNDFGSGMVTLFDLLIIANWNTYMEAYVAVTGSSWARAYFVVFYVFVVLFLLNLVVAFVLQGFLTNMRIQELKERELDNGEQPGDEASLTSVLTRASSRGRHWEGASMRMARGSGEALMHSMLRDELAEARVNAMHRVPSCTAHWGLD